MKGSLIYRTVQSLTEICAYVDFSKYQLSAQFF